MAPPSRGTGKPLVNGRTKKEARQRKLKQQRDWAARKKLEKEAIAASAALMGLAGGSASVTHPLGDAPPTGHASTTTLALPAPPAVEDSSLADELGDDALPTDDGDDLGASNSLKGRLLRKLFLKHSPTPYLGVVLTKPNEDGACNVLQVASSF